MAKDSKILIEACALFLKKNKIEIAYSSEHKKLIGKQKIILLNGIRVTRKKLGESIYIEMEKYFDFYKKWNELQSDLASQVLSTIAPLP